MALSEDIVHLWSMDETAGNRSDEIGSNTLTDINTVGAVAGKLGTAASFVAANSGRLIGAVVGFGATDYTLSTWVRLASKPAFGPVVVESSGFSAPRTSLQLDYSSTLDRFRAIVFESSTVHILTLSNSGPLSTGMWYHLLVRYSKTTGVLRGRVNGGTDNSAATSTLINQPVGAILEIGSQTGAGGRYFDGLIDQTAVWSRQISDDEGDEIYNAGDGLAYPFAADAIAESQSTGVPLA